MTQTIHRPAIGSVVQVFVQNGTKDPNRVIARPGIVLGVEIVDNADEKQCYIDVRLLGPYNGRFFDDAVFDRVPHSSAGQKGHWRYVPQGDQNIEVDR